VCMCVSSIVCVYRVFVCRVLCVAGWAQAGVGSAADLKVRVAAAHLAQLAISSAAQLAAFIVDTQQTQQQQQHQYQQHSHNED